MNALRKLGITCKESEVYDHQGNDLRTEGLLFWIDNESNVETEYHLEGGQWGNPTETFEQVCEEFNLFVEPFNSSIYLVYLDDIPEPTEVPADVLALDSDCHAIDRCDFCGSHEVTYHQYIGDSYCSDCGEWQSE